MTLMLSVILLSMLVILLSTLNVIRHLICGNQLNWLLNWIQIESEDTVDWERNWLVEFNARKTQLISFDWSKNTGAIDVEMDGSVLEEKSYFMMLGLNFSSKLDSLLKPPPKKLESSFALWTFFLLRLLCISINLPYRHLWNNAVMSELVLLVATWNCWISYKNRYAGLLVLHLLPLLNHWLIIKM